jgi:hypothetical protein
MRLRRYTGPGRRAINPPPRCPMCQGNVVYEWQDATDPEDDEPMFSLDMQRCTTATCQMRAPREDADWRAEWNIWIFQSQLLGVVSVGH